MFRMKTDALSVSPSSGSLTHLVLIARVLHSLSFRYFEQRLRVTEENYREEIALLQLRLVEGALEESVLKTKDDR